jgi:hypothetical protein
MRKPYVAASPALETVIRLSARAVIDTDTDDCGPPILWLREGSSELLIMPSACDDGRPMDTSDLDRASDLVMAAVVYRNAIHSVLARAGVIPPPQPRRRRGF